MARFSTLRCLFAIAARKDYDIEYLDVVTAFLNGEFDEEVYMELPEGIVKEDKNKVYILKKALYELKQGTYAWHKKLDKTLQELGFKRSEIDQSMYTYT